MPDARGMKVYCLGASITAGMTGFGIPWHPYAHQLQRRLRSDPLASAGSVAAADGRVGDRLVGGQYKPRLAKRLGRNFMAPEQQPRYDWIVVQGGGNDLAAGIPPKQVFAALEKLWREIRKARSKIVALTVTETSDRSERGRTRLHALNNMILAQEPASDLVVVDLCKSMPWPEDDAETRQAFWSDGLHFTAAGYDRIGDLIADGLLEALRGCKSRL